MCSGLVSLPHSDCLLLGWPAVHGAYSVADHALMDFQPRDVISPPRVPGRDLIDYLLKDGEAKGSRRAAQTR